MLCFGAGGGLNDSPPPTSVWATGYQKTHLPGRGNLLV